MLPIILPPQSQPVISTAKDPDAQPLFLASWYLFFEAVKNALVAGLELVLYGPSADRVLFDPTDLINGSLWFENDTHLIYQWDASLAEWVGLSLASKNGATGTDSVGTVFAGGIATAIGAGAVPISGFPGSYASVALTGQTTSSGPTNIQHASAVLPTGRYLIAVTAIVTATGTNNLTVTISWSDGTATETIQLGPQTMSASPARLQAVQHAVLNGSTNLTYQVTISGGSGGTAKIWIDVVRLV